MSHRLGTYRGTVHRVFSTAYPSQELLDDLLDDPDERAALAPHYYTDETPAQMNRLERILKRSSRDIIQAEVDSKFQPTSWYASRYCDGTWSVLYAAESSQTAQRESLYHKRRFYREELAVGPVKIDLCEAKLRIASAACVDVEQIEGVDRALLTSQDESGYPYCQELAREARDAGAELLRAPSARDPGGHCTPIFDRSAVAHDSGPLRYIKCVLTAHDTHVFPGAWC